MSLNHHPQDRQRLNRRRLALAFGMQAVFCVVELVGGILTNSLALLADAGHMLSDVAALGLSLLAMYWSLRPPTARRTFGYHRLEILAALVNGLLLCGISLYIFAEAYGRFFQPPGLNSLPLLVIASLGLLVNLAGVWILYPGQKQNLNIRSAFLHLLADSLGSLAAITAGVAIFWKQWYWFDPLAGCVIGVMIIAGSWRLVWEAADILMEATPRHISLNAVQSALEGYRGVQQVHDLHIWTIASGLYALSAHVVVADGLDRDCLIQDLGDLLHQRFGLEHNTLQIESTNGACTSVCLWHEITQRQPKPAPG